MSEFVSDFGFETVNEVSPKETGTQDSHLDESVSQPLPESESPPEEKPCIKELQQRQDEVNQKLDELYDQIELVIKTYLAERRENDGEALQSPDEGSKADSIAA